MLNSVNEMAGLFAGYLVLILQDMQYTPDEHLKIGKSVVFIIYAQAVTNGMTILVEICLDLKQSVKRCRSWCLLRR